MCTAFPVVIWELKNQNCLTETSWDCFFSSFFNSQENYIFWAQKIQEWSVIANSKSFFSFRNKMKTKKEWSCHAERTGQDKPSFSVWIQKFQLTFNMGWLAVRKGGDGGKMTKFKMKARGKMLYQCNICAIISILESWENIYFIGTVNPVFLWIYQVSCTIANTATLFKKG